MPSPLFHFIAGHGERSILRLTTADERTESRRPGATSIANLGSIQKVGQPFDDAKIERFGSDGKPIPQLRP
jgi:hypothetical protein